jgi:tetratricopeptide (TPR) repeat protein
MDLLSNLGAIADAQGDYKTALQRFDAALTIAREMGYKDGEIVFLTNRGGAQSALNNFEAAETDLRQSIRMAGIEGSWIMPLTFNYHAEALIGLGRYEEAFYSARQALVLAEEDKTPEYIGMAWRTLGMISDRLGKPVRFSDWKTHKIQDHDAKLCFSTSEKIFVEAEIEFEQARTLREWAKYELKNGDKMQGKKLWKKARDLYLKLGAQMEVERMRELPS